jgi:hypothetical protein
MSLWCSVSYIGFSANLESIFPLAKQNYEGHFINNAHFFLRTSAFYFRQYLFTVLLCSPPAWQ